MVHGRHTTNEKIKKIYLSVTESVPNAKSYKRKYLVIIDELCMGEQSSMEIPRQAPSRTPSRRPTRGQDTRHMDGNQTDSV